MQDMLEHRKRIVIFYSRIVEVGGAERVALEETRHFSRKFDTQLLTFNLKPEALLEYKDLRIVNLNFKNDSKYFTFTQTLKRTLALARELKRSKTDLVIACSTAGIYEVFLATLLYPIPYVLHIHGTIFWFNDDHTKYASIFKRAFNKIRLSLRGHTEFVAPNISLSIPQRIKLELFAIINYFAVKRAEAILVLSNHMKWEVEQLYGKEAMIVPLKLVPHSFQKETPRKDIRKELEIDKDTRIVLSICRLDPRKRIDLLIKSLAEILKRTDDVVLVIGGKGSEEKSLKELSRSLGVEANVRFVGFVPESELIDYYSACDVFAYPGWGDFALTVYEALAVNKKIVCSSEMEMPEHEGILKAEPIVDDFAAKLKKAIDERSEIRTKEILGESGLDRLEGIVKRQI